MEQDAPRAQNGARADAYAAAVEQSAWDGAWYRRAYFDDGSPLGTATDDECQIDAIAQSWAVLSGAADLPRALIARHGAPVPAAASIDDATAAWDERLSVIKVHTPNAEFDALFNRWSLYQALSCRMWARSALYQSGGAYGFRDQLQDCMAFVYAEPQITRAHLLRAAGRQFTEGDVQHWWHEPSSRGVRTRFSDDLAWLPFVADHYVRVTGDAAVWDATAPYLSMRPLAADEPEAYDLPTDSGETGKRLAE